MADKIVLKLNNTALDLTADKYEESTEHVDTLTKSEAGTNLRAVVRTGINNLAVSYQCDAAEKAKLDAFNKASKLTAKKWSEEAGAEVSWACFMKNYKAPLIVETPTTRWYKVSFNLIDLEN